MYKYFGSIYFDNCMYVIFIDIYMGLWSLGYLFFGLGNVVWYGDGVLMLVFRIVILYWCNVDIEYLDYLIL